MARPETSTTIFNNANNINGVQFKLGDDSEPKFDFENTNFALSDLQTGLVDRNMEFSGETLPDIPFTPNTTQSSSVTQQPQQDTQIQQAEQNPSNSTNDPEGEKNEDYKITLRLRENDAFWKMLDALRETNNSIKEIGEIAQGSMRPTV